MELALTDDNTKEMLLRKDMEKEAVEAVGAYLKEAVAAMGPPLLELAARRIGMPLTQPNYHRGDGASTRQDASEQDGCSYSKVDRWPTPVVNKVTKDLKTSCADLLMAVRDPLPDAVVVASRLTEATKVNELQENHDKVDMNELGDDLRNTEAPQGNHCEVEVNEPVGLERGDEVPCAKGSDTGTVQGKDDVASQPPLDANPKPHSKVLDRNGNSVAVNAPEQSVGGGADVTHKEGTSTGTERHKPSLMDRNPTAHTYEWDDSIDSPYESSPNPSNILRLSSPKRRVISPLKLIENKKLNRRRKVKKWSLLEEDTLRDAVKKYGAGNWKNILSSNSEIFEERTEVDLKDKWRNMTKH